MAAINGRGLNGGEYNITDTPLSEYVRQRKNVRNHLDIMLLK